MASSLVSFEPAETKEEALQRAAKAWGIQTEYFDIWGNRHVAEPSTLVAILESLGVDASSREQLNFAMEERLWNQWSAAVASTLVRPQTAEHIPIHVPAAFLNGHIEVEFLWEQGTTERFAGPVASLNEGATAALRGEMFHRKHLPLPAAAPLGYHKLRVALRIERLASVQAECRLILCPDRAHVPDEFVAGRGLGGITVSLYGLRSNRNWGCGDFTDLKRLTEWAAEELNAGFIGLNPLHAISNRQPYNTSPYLPACIFYRNPLYLDVEAIADVRNSPWIQRLLASERTMSALDELRNARYVEYEKIWNLKKPFLKLAFRQFLREYRSGTARAQEFRKYIESEGEPLDRYALYCTLEGTIHRKHPDIWIWPDWPAEYRDPSTPEVTAFVRAKWRTILFQKYLQWQVDLQLAAAQRHAIDQGMPIGLYHDLALATDRCGGDLWAHRDFYVSGARVGSPPDDFSPKGQDWGFPPPNSERHREDGYRLFADSIRKNLRHGGALRIDHVMRLFRLFWIPDDKQAAGGAYVRDRADDLLRILALESVRNRVVIVGEDLGTVEPEVRESLQSYGILSYRLLYFEKHPDKSFRLPEEYPRQALVSASTHDLPTLAGFWQNRDIEARKRAGLLPHEESYQEQLRIRAGEKQKLLDLFFDRGLLPSYLPHLASKIPEFTGELHNAAIGFLASTPSMLFALSQEDLFKEMDQQNLPGSTEQYPNWRHKMRFSVDELRSDQLVRDFAVMFRNWLAREGRTSGAG